jgi:hypothetical protein
VDELIRSIAEKKAELDRLRVAAPGGLSNFEHTQDIELTYTSNAIEGNTLTAIGAHGGRPGPSRGVGLAGKRKLTPQSQRNATLG